MENRSKCGADDVDEAPAQSPGRRGVPAAPRATTAASSAHGARATSPANDDETWATAPPKRRAAPPRTARTSVEGRAAYDTACASGGDTARIAVELSQYVKRRPVSRASYGTGAGLPGARETRRQASASSQDAS